MRVLRAFWVLRVSWVLRVFWVLRVSRVLRVFWVLRVFGIEGILILRVFWVLQVLWVLRCFYWLLSAYMFFQSCENFGWQKNGEIFEIGWQN